MLTDTIRVEIDQFLRNTSVVSGVIDVARCEYAGMTADAEIAHAMGATEMQVRRYRAVLGVVRDGHTPTSAEDATEAVRLAGLLLDRYRGALSAKGADHLQRVVADFSDADPYTFELALLKADAILRAQTRHNHTLPAEVTVVFRRYGNRGGGRWEARSVNVTSRCASQDDATREAWWLVACNDANRFHPTPPVRYRCSGCGRTDDEHPFAACPGAHWDAVEAPSVHTA